MKKIIRSIDEFPADFDIRKYRQLRDLTLEDWSALVSTRFHLRRQLDAAALAALAITPQLQAEVLALLASPMPSLENLSEDRTAAADEVHSINSPTLFSYFSIAYDRQRFGEAIAAYEGYANHGELTAVQREILATPVFLAGTPPYTDLRPLNLPVEVGLWAPDAILIDDFKRWLRHVRQQIGTIETTSGRGNHRTELSAEKLYAIASSGAIPYIDLCMWADAFGKRIPAPVMAKAITGDEDQNRRIEQTTAVWANWLLTPRTTEVLEGQCCARPA